MYLTLILQRMIRTSYTRVQTVMIPHSINVSQIILNDPYLTLVWPEECNPILMTIKIERSFKMRVWKWVYFLGKSKMSPCVSLWQYIKVVWQMIFRLSFVCNLCLHINEKEFDFRSLTVRILESGISFWRSTNIKVKSTAKLWSRGRSGFWTPEILDQNSEAWRSKKWLGRFIKWIYRVLRL